MEKLKVGMTLEEAYPLLQPYFIVTFQVRDKSNKKLILNNTVMSCHIEDYTDEGGNDYKYFHDQDRNVYIEITQLQRYKLARMDDDAGGSPLHFFFLCLV